MLTEHHKIELLDKNKKHHFYAEVNWKPDDESTNNCKIIKLTGPDGSTAYVERKHFLEFIFAIGNAQEQVKMVPQTLKKVRWYETILSVRATKDIRRGEEITFPVKLSLPPIEEEVIGRVRESKTKTNIPIIGDSPIAK